MSIFHEVNQNRRIDGAAGKALSAQQEIGALATKVNDLERRVDRLALVSQALWELLRERTDLSDHEVYEKVAEIDMRDGVADGKITPKVTKCPNCNRPVAAGRSVCMYCGAQFTPEQMVR